MGGRLFIVTALLVFAIGLLSSCGQNPSTEGDDASAARTEAQGNAEQPSEEPTLMRDAPESTMTTASGTASESEMGILAGGKPPPEYQVKKDGTLIIGGDVLVSCTDLLKSSWEGQSPTPEARRQMRQANKEQVRVCTKAGFPPDKTPQSP